MKIIDMLSGPSVIEKAATTYYKSDVRWIVPWEDNGTLRKAACVADEVFG